MPDTRRSSTDFLFKGLSRLLVFMVAIITPLVISTVVGVLIYQQIKLKEVVDRQAKQDISFCRSQEDSRHTLRQLLVDSLALRAKRLADGDPTVRPLTEIEKKITRDTFKRVGTPACVKELHLKPAFKEPPIPLVDTQVPEQRP